MKNFTGPGNLSASLSLPELPKLEAHYAKSFALYSLEGEVFSEAQIQLFDPVSRQSIWASALSSDGTTQLTQAEQVQDYLALAGYDAWTAQFEDVDDSEIADTDLSAEDPLSDEEGREEESDVMDERHGH
jgi:hypothetical protein